MSAWDEAEKKDKLNSKFFSVESNMKYKLTFSAEPMEDTDSFDKKCITGRLVKKVVPVWENGKKTDRSEEKFVLQLVIETLDGTPCRKIWNCKNAKMRNLFRTYAENDLLTKKIFVVEVKGELMKGNYNVVALDKTTKKGEVVPFA
jgi:hypothetical protein